MEKPGTRFRAFSHLDARQKGRDLRSAANGFTAIPRSTIANQFAEAILEPNIIPCELISASAGRD